jgi:putative colanic acid biosynthesis acetyltransferase WcaF
MSDEKKIQVQLSTFNNRWYKPGSFFKRALWLLVNVFLFNNSLAVFNGLKIRLLRLFGAKVGKRVLIKPGVNIKYPWFLTIGDNCWIGENVWIDNLAKVTIGNNVCISQGAMLLTGNHDYNKTSFDLQVSEITLENGVWVGARSVVCPGVYCESHSVLSVQSVATQRMNAYSIYQGNPAQAVKARKITIETL